MAPLLVPHLLRAELSGTAGEAQAMLRDWDFQQPAEGEAGTPQARSSAAAANNNAVWRHLLLRLFDELPDDRMPDGGDRWFEVVRGLLDRPASPWWDDRSTPPVETPADVVAAAMRAAATELSDRLGDDPARWRWGRLHRITVRNQSFGSSGIGVVEWLFNLEPAGASGGDSIVNATGWTAAEGYEVDWVPSMRMIVDLADPDASRWIHLTGQSGHAFHDHYDDQFELWRTGETIPMRWQRTTIEHEARHTVTLRP
jgi:penicillin amidase